MNTYSELWEGGRKKKPASAKQLKAKHMAMLAKAALEFPPNIPGKTATLAGFYLRLNHI